MRVLYFSRDYTPHDHRFLSALADTSHEVFYLRLEDRGLNLESRPLPPKVQLVDWWVSGRPHRWLDAPQSVLRLRSLLDRLEPDLVHAGPVQSPAGLVAAAGFHPLVTMSWGSDLLVGARRGIGRFLAGYALGRSDVFVCDCQAVRQAAEGLGMDPDRIVVFPWGVDLDRFSPGKPNGLRKTLGWESDLVLLSCRSWEPQYGVDDVVDAFVSVSATVPNLRMILLGNGSQGSKLRHVIASAGLQDRVHFGGQVPNDALPEYYRSADLYVSASHSDGSSVSLMEALASGLPALVSDIPGNREWITPGEQGWWFRVGDRESLAGRLREAVEHRRELGAMGKSSHERAVARADWPANFKHLLDAYDLACAGQG